MAKQLLNHKWIRDAKTSQEKSQLGGTTIEDAEKAISDAKLKRMSLLIKSLQQQQSLPSPSQQAQRLSPSLSCSINPGSAAGGGGSGGSNALKPLFQLEGVSSIDESDDFDASYDAENVDLCASMEELLKSTQTGGGGGGGGCSSSGGGAAAGSSSTPSKVSVTSELNDLRTLLDAGTTTAGTGTGVEELSGSSDQLSFGDDLLKDLNLDGLDKLEKIQGKNDAGMSLELLLPENNGDGGGGGGGGEEEAGIGGGGEDWDEGSSDLSSEDDEAKLLKENQGCFQELICAKYKVLQNGGQSDSEALMTFADMLSCINEYSSVKVRAFLQVGVAPVVDVLMTAIVKSEELQVVVLKVVNKIVEDSPDLMRLLAAAGGIPPFDVFAKNASSLDVLNEVVAFYDKLYALQRAMFFGNNGVAVILGMLRSISEDPAGSELDCSLGLLRTVLASLHDEKARALVDIAHSYLRESVTEILSGVIASFRAAEGAQQVFAVIANIFLELSTADDMVRAHLCKKDTLASLVKLFTGVRRAEDPTLEVKLAVAKTVENLTATAQNVAALRHEGVLRILLEQLSDPKSGIPASAEVRQCIYTLANRAVNFDPTLNPELIKFGIVPVLCADVNTPPLDTIAVPFLSHLLKNAKRRDAFSRCKFLDILVGLLNSKTYALKAMETIAWWLDKDTMYVKSKIAQPKVLAELTTSFEESPLWDCMLVAIISIIRKSKTFAQKLGAIHEFMNCLMARLAVATPENTLKIINALDALYDGAGKKRDFVAEYDLHKILAELRKTHSTKVVVCRALDKLIKKMN